MAAEDWSGCSVLNSDYEGTDLHSRHGWYTVRGVSRTWWVSVESCQRLELQAVPARPAGYSKLAILSSLLPSDPPSQSIPHPSACGLPGRRLTAGGGYD